MPKKLRLSFFQVIIFSSLILLSFRIAWPSLLQLYVKLGMGDCISLPVLCKCPQAEINSPSSDNNFIDSLKPLEFPDMSIKVPDSFIVVKENITKSNLKKYKPKKTDQTIYILYEKPGFFLRLFPELEKKGITGDYDFLSRVMNAKTENILNLNDAFFSIMKGIFIPDLEDQKTIVMAKFSNGILKGFINYNITQNGNYFDFNLINEKNEFLKVYIKDKKGEISLNKALNLISTIKTK